MNAMQVFYERLCRARQVYDPAFSGLVRLTQATPDELAGLQNELQWTTWSADPAA